MCKSNYGKCLEPALLPITKFYTPNERTQVVFPLPVNFTTQFVTVHEYIFAFKGHNAML